MTMSCGPDGDDPSHLEVGDEAWRDQLRMSLQAKLDIIAHILEVPVDTLQNSGEKSFFETRSTTDLATESECNALLSAFRQITDPAVRRRYVALLQSVAAGR